MTEEAVWFIGPWDRPGYYLRVSTRPGRSRFPTDIKNYESTHRPPDFPWSSMDRRWSASYERQGTTGMDCLDGWTVLSVADYTIDRRPNVLVAFAVHRENVSEAEMRQLAQDRYPVVYNRLKVKPLPL